MNADARGWRTVKATAGSPDSRFQISICLRWSACIGGCIFLIGGCTRTKPPARLEPTAVTTRPVQNTADVAEAMQLIDRRDEWTTLPAVNIPHHPGEKFLKDMTIVIDPGHGGTDGGNVSTQPRGYKASAAGDKEAFINLRVALLLERLLSDAGAHAVMTRHGDDTINLVQRAQIANAARRRRDGGIGADVFVSIHHNAGSKTSNYPSVWYHGTVDDNEPDMDIARHIAQGLGREMRTQVAKTSPIFSSQLMYASGFGVLRACQVPGVLCESSFFSDPAEAQRLREPVYNLREAYAIYTGLCEWAYCGRPTQTLPTLTRDASAAGGGDQWLLKTTLDEGLPAWWGSDRSRILKSSLRVAMPDGRELPHRFDELSRELTVILSARDLAAAGPETNDGGQYIIIQHQNMLKNTNWPQRYLLTVNDARTGDGEATRVRAMPARRPGRQPATRPIAKP